MSKQMSKYNKTKAVFDKQVAAMKQNEEAAGLWCVCGHSSPTHDVGFTCQSVGCDCLNFRPSNAVPATTQGQHTPTPWKVEAWEVKPSVGFYVVVDQDGINMAQSKSRHVAERIANEHNNHQKLVDALRDIAKGGGDYNYKGDKERLRFALSDIEAMASQARALLAEVQADAD